MMAPREESSRAVEHLGGVIAESSPHGRTAEQVMDSLGVPRCDKSVYQRCWVRNCGQSTMERLGEECLACERWAKISSGEIQGWSKREVNR